MDDQKKTETFEDLGLRPEIVQTLRDLGYEAPTPIQMQTIPLLLAGGDLIGQAQTGTGKTAAFALPILQALDPRSNATQALVLAPTRELAMQVAEAVHSYSKRIGNVTVQPIYGGAPIGLQLKHLKRGVQVVVGTPGRLIDHLERGSLDLSNIRMLVLDEADEMLRMGFIEDVEKILQAAPDERQIALFSATMPPEVLRIAKNHLKDPERVEIAHRTMTAPAIEQRFLNVSENQKLAVLTQILELEPSEAVLVFRRTKIGAAELSEKLEARGFASVALHGDMTQSAREAVIRRLRSGLVEVVVATDVAARGLDVEQIEHVVNYDIPYDVEAYVHRIGRTGRAGRSGVATLFVTPRERRMLREIERYTGKSIEPMKMPTHADVAAKRLDVLKENLRTELSQGDLESYASVAEDLVNEGQFELKQVAAAALRLASAAKGLATPIEATPPPQEKDRTSRGSGRASGAARSGKERREGPRDSARSNTGRDEPKVQLMMGLGATAGIRPADVVGSIANEAGISGSDIGPIDIRDEFTLVTIPKKDQGKVLAALKAARFRGKRFEIRTASDEDRSAPKSRSRTDEKPAARPRATDRPDRKGAPAARPESKGRYGDKPQRTGRFSDKPARAGKSSDHKPGRPKRAFDDRPGKPAKGRSKGAPKKSDRKPETKKPFYSGVSKGPAKKK